jgi:outer membrane immunogenic protein
MSMNGNLGLFGLALIIASPALAADLSTGAPVNRVPGWIVASWTGCYGGVNVGGVRGGAKYTWSGISEGLTGFDTGAATALPATANATLSSSGVVVGGQLGCMYQEGVWVWGAEGDFQYTGLNAGRSAISAPVTSVGSPPLVPGQITETFDSRWLSTVRGRLGYTTGPVLIYGTGGVAIADVNYADQVCFPTAVTSTCNTASSGVIRVGWTAGGGIEWELATLWTVKVEYLYADLGSTAFTSQNSLPLLFPQATILHSHHLTENIGRLGLNYRF